MARRFELGRIGYRGDNGRGGNTADPRDGGETPAGFIAAVPGSDRLFDQNSNNNQRMIAQPWGKPLDSEKPHTSHTNSTSNRFRQGSKPWPISRGTGSLKPFP